MANLYINDGGDYRIEDEDGNVVAQYDESADEWVFNGVDVQGVGAFASQSVSTEEASIRDFSKVASYTVSYDASRPTGEELAVTESDGSVFRQGADLDLATFLQDIDNQGNQYRVHFCERPGVYLIDSQVEFTNEFHMSGDGKNRTTIQPTDDLTNDMFVLGGTGTQFITRFSDIKLFGSRSTQAGTISGIRNENHNELLFDHTEVRSFTNHGVHWLASVSDSSWNQANESWFLDNAGSDFYFDAAMTGSVDEYHFNDCLVLARNVNDPAGIYVEAGAPVKHLSITGGRFMNRDAILLSGGEYINITGSTFVTEDFRPLQFFTRSSEGGIASVTGCTFEDKSSGQAGSHIIVRDTWSDVTISDNEMDSNPPNPVEVQDPTTVWRNGTQELSGAPTAANYTSAHAGRRILDTSTTPTDVYYVLNDGSVDGPV